MRASLRGTELPLNRLRQEMDRLMTDFFGNGSNLGAFGGGLRLSGAAFPPVNVWEDGEHVFVEAELPGVKQEDLEITVVANELSLRGQRKPNDAEGVAYHRRERAAGEFTRLLRLPVDVEAEHVHATLTKGVLTVALPKAQAARPRKVEVRSST